MPRRSFAVVAVLLLAGCTDEPQPRPTTAVTAAVATVAPSPTPVPCSLGEVRFGPVKNGYLLTELSPVMTITAPGGGRLDKPKELLRRPRVEVRAGGEVPHEYVYEKLADRYEVALAEYGTEYQPAGPGSAEMGGPGRFVELEAVRTIDVTFTYECGGVTSHGSIRTWRNGSDSGLLNCDQLSRDPDPKERALFGEAVKLRC